MRRRRWQSKPAKRKPRPRPKSKAASKKVVKLKSKKPAAKAEIRQRPAEAVVQALRPGRQGARRRQDPRLHPRPVRPDLHAASGLSRRRLHQGRAARRRRHHARPVARREGRGLALFHHAQRQQALDHDRQQASQGQGNPRAADQALRRAGRELRARRARPHGADLGLHPQDQPAHDRRFGQGLRPRPLRGLQGLRERRAMHRRRGLDHRLPRGPAARHRRADRRQRHRPASRVRHLRRALPAHPHRPRPEGVRARCRTACSTSRASSCATSSVSRTVRSPNTASTARASRSATRRRAPATIPAAASPAGS